MPITVPAARKGPKGTWSLRLRIFRAISATPSTAPRRNPRKIPSADRAPGDPPERDSEAEAELHVAEAHAARRDQVDHEECHVGRGAAEHRPGEVVARTVDHCRQAEEDDQRDRQRVHDPVREQERVQIDHREREQRRDEHEIGRQRPAVAEAQRHRDPEQRVERLHQRVPRRDADAAAIGTCPAAGATRPRGCCPGER